MAERMPRNTNTGETEQEFTTGAVATPAQEDKFAGLMERVGSSMRERGGTGQFKFSEVEGKGGSMEVTITPERLWVKSAPPKRGRHERDAELLEMYSEYTAPPAVRVSPVRTSSYSGKRDKIAVVVPDIQYGYRIVDGEYVPVHDPRALNVGRQVIRHIGTELDLLVNIGDALDLEEFSKHVDDPAAWNTGAKRNRDFQRDVTAGMRADAPNARHILLEGNHEKRYRQYIMEKAPHLVGERIITANGELGRSALSLATIFSFDELEIEYLEGYPQNYFQINDRLRAIHGEISDTQGSTVHKILRAGNAIPGMSYVSGHTHRAERASRTVYMPDGSRRVVSAESFGTLCRIDGNVPSGRMGRRTDNSVEGSLPNWQQGIGVVYYRDGDAPFKTEFVPINTEDGYEAWFDGRVFVPTVDELGNPLDK